MADGKRIGRSYQADRRENQMVDRFNLIKVGEAGEDLNGDRAGTDAWLELDGKRIPFELKSTDTKSISTVRDLGADHLRKWRELHWLFGFYEKGADAPHKRYIYASPAQMRPWVDGLERYVDLDRFLVRRLPILIDQHLFAEMWVGDRRYYTYRDARRLLKQQKLDELTDEIRDVLFAVGLVKVRSDGTEQGPRAMGKKVYAALRDHTPGFTPARFEEIEAELSDPVEPNLREATLELGEPLPFDNVYKLLRKRSRQAGGRVTKDWLQGRIDAEYSAERMLQLVRLRCAYLLARGSTRNNPHISEKQLLALVPKDQVFTGHYYSNLVRLVRRALTTT